jgi:MFS family permease
VRITDVPLPINTGSAAPPSKYKWTVVALLWFICFFNYADRQAISAVLPLLQTELHLNKAEQGLIVSAFAWVYAFTAPFAGQVGDRSSRKLLIIGGLYAWSLVTGFTALCSKTWHFVLVRGAEGLGETFYFPASMSLISDYHGKRTRSRAMSLHQTSVYAGTIGGSAITAYLAQEYGWRWPFVIFAVLGMVLGLVLSVFIREPRRNQAEREESGSAPVEAPQIPMRTFLREWVRTPTAMLLVIAFFGANFVALIFLAWMPTFLKEKFKLKLAMAGLEATVYIQIASMVGAALSGAMADRWRNAQPGGRMLAQSVGALIGAPFIFLCGYTTDKVTLVAAMTAFGLCKGIYDGNIWASLYDVVPASRRGAAVGMMNMIAWIGGALGPVAVGFAVDRGATMSAAISSTAVIYTGVSALLIVAGLRFAPRDIARARIAG